jgi:hypothetical protein
MTVPSIPLRSRSASPAIGLMRVWRALGSAGHMIRSISSRISGYGVSKLLAFGPSQYRSWCCIRNPMSGLSTAIP